MFFLLCVMICFNSRTPGGVRQEIIPRAHACPLFQFTHPGRGATPTIGMLRLDDVVSIHAPREGCDN